MSKNPVNNELKKQIFVFPDTNIFLHFKFFTEIEWDKIIGAKTITLVIPPIIARELDKHKYNNSSERVKERAKKVTKKLGEVLRSNEVVRPNVLIRFESTEPTTEFEKYFLSKDSQDDHLMASIMRFAAETDGDIVLVTDDISLSVKAHALNIDVFEFPDNLRNKAEDNPDKKKIKKLEGELIEAKSRIPIVKATFADGKQYHNASFLESNPRSIADVEKEVAQIKENHKEIRIASDEGVAPTQRVVIDGHTGAKSSVEFWKIQKYNDELQIYYREEEKYIRAEAKIERLKSRTIRLEIAIEVGGSAPGEDINLFLIFPTNIKIFADNKAFLRPEHVSIPSMPHYDSSGDAYEPYYSTVLKRQYPNSSIDRIYDVIFPELVTWAKLENRDNRDQVRYSIPKLNHGFSSQLINPIYLEVHDITEGVSFSIDYIILAANIPKPTYGELSVILENKKDAKK